VGIVITDLGSNEIGYAVAIQDDNRIVVGGHIGGDFALARYTITGTLDTSFDVDGWTSTDFGSSDNAQAVAIGSDGKIVLAGYSGNYLALARYRSDGSLDPSFGTGGRANLYGDKGSPMGDGRGVAIQPDGRIVVVGYLNSPYDLALVRYWVKQVFLPFVLRNY
jgi:uncharacterized delta-60 repeat protein